MFESAIIVMKNTIEHCSKVFIVDFFRTLGHLVHRWSSNQQRSSMQFLTSVLYYLQWRRIDEEQADPPRFFCLNFLIPQITTYTTEMIYLQAELLPGFSLLQLPINEFPIISSLKKGRGFQYNFSAGWLITLLRFLLCERKCIRGSRVWQFHKIAVSDVPGQIPKIIYQTSYFLPNDFPNNFS